MEWVEGRLSHFAYFHLIKTVDDHSTFVRQTTRSASQSLQTSGNYQRLTFSTNVFKTDSVNSPDNDYGVQYA